MTWQEALHQGSSWQSCPHCIWALRMFWDMTSITLPLSDDIQHPKYLNDGTMPMLEVPAVISDV